MMTTSETVPAPTAATARDPGTQRPADVFVVFGITGDLASVMTFRSLYRLEQRGMLDCPIVGVAVDDWSLDQLAQRARDSIVGTGEQLDEKVFTRLVERFSYVQGDFGDPGVYERVAEAISGAETPVFYLEIPPFLFGRVVQGLAEAGLTKGARVVVEVLQRPKGLQAFRILSMDESTAVHPAQLPPPRTHVSVTPTSGLERAQVKWFNRLRGFGFLTRGEGTPDIFVHMETLRRFGLAELTGARADGELAR